MYCICFANSINNILLKKDGIRFYIEGFNCNITEKNIIKSYILKTNDKNFGIDISINARSTSSILIFIGIVFIFLKKLKL